ncbi:MAG: hypothetical protein HC915_03665 [Anaerolineae bacterium]|nr:hypothetical protein [Anaerolineae bacterium]
MSQGPLTKILAAIQLPSIARYREGLRKEPTFEVNLVTSLDKARDTLDDPAQQIDVFVVDSGLGEVHEIIREVRQSYPRLIILLVDENADFAMPGRADDVSTTPFEDNDLVNRIKRLNESRRLQTLRADALPPVRQFAKSILKATSTGSVSKQQAAVEAVKELGYDYVAFYKVLPGDPPDVSLLAQVGADDAKREAPKKPALNDSMVGWVVQNGKSRTITPTEEINHPLVKSGRFKIGVGVPVGTNLRFGVLIACKEAEASISQENVMMLELISAQLASALAKDARS